MNILKILLQQLKTQHDAKRKLLLIAGCFLLIGTIIVNWDWVSSSWPTSTQLTNELDALALKQEKLKKTIRRLELQDRQIAEVTGSRNDFWLSKRDGNPENELRKRIETAAQNNGLIIRSLGNLRKTKIGDNIWSCELNIAGEADIKAAMRFFESSGKQYAALVLE